MLLPFINFKIRESRTVYLNFADNKHLIKESWISSLLVQTEVQEFAVPLDGLYGINYIHFMSLTGYFSWKWSDFIYSVTPLHWYQKNW